MAYRGKYPQRINTVSSVNARKGVLVYLNNGEKMMIIPRNAEGAKRMPKPGDDMLRFGNLNYTLQAFVAPTQAEITALIIAEFMRNNPDWKPEFDDELANVCEYLFSEGNIRLSTSIKRAALIVADFIF